MKPQEMKYISIIVGIVVLLGVIGGGWYFLSQSSASLTPVATPTPSGPVTALRCDSAYYNYVVGRPEVIAAASGADTTATQKVSCQFNYTDPQGASSTATADALLQDIGNGKTWKCYDKNKIFPKGTTKFSVGITDDRGETASCNSSIFLQ